MSPEPRRDMRRGNPVRPNVRKQAEEDRRARTGEGEEGRIQNVSECPQWLKPFPQPEEMEESARNEEEQEKEQEGKTERKMKVASNVNGPSAKEYEEHQVTHAEYRSWCEACVMGSGRPRGHPSSPADPEEEPVISIDFASMAAE